MKTGTSDRIREYARREYIEPNRKRGEITVRIVAGDVHKALGLHNRSPQVCSALRSQKFLDENHLVLVKPPEGPPGGMSTTMTFTYRLLDADNQQPKPETDRFLRLYGIGKEVFASLGGGEAFIRSERENFYGEKKEHP
jgi:5-methylcytosine-specific restriction enzyme B